MGMYYTNIFIGFRFVLLHNMKRHADNNSRKNNRGGIIHMMSRAFMRVTRGIIIGLVVGSAIGAVAAAMMRPKKLLQTQCRTCA